MYVTATGESTYHKPYWRVYRKLYDGKAVTGTSGLVYSDAAAMDGYQLVPAAEVTCIRVNDMIPAGTSHESVPVNDPRPDIMPGANYGAGQKLVASTYRRVTEIGQPQVMLEDRVTEDEDSLVASFDGQRTVSYTKVQVCKVYFEQIREAHHNW